VRGVASTKEPSQGREFAGPRARAQPSRDARLTPRHEAILRLQTTAGNAAPARVIQPKIGFEFEADMWLSWSKRRRDLLNTTLAPAIRDRAASRLPHMHVCVTVSPRSL
jgi:hypothetical protein